MNDGLDLNGTFYDHPTLVGLACMRQAERRDPDWEWAFWNFLASWFSDEPDLAVKTSGSTGRPKLLQIDKKYFINSARMTLEFLHIQPGAHALLCLSPAYIAGKMMIVRSLIGGLKLTAISPQVSSLLLQDNSYDLAAMVPLQVQTLLDQPEGRRRLAKIDTLLIGGSPVSPELEARLQGLNNRIYVTYGMTETVSHIALRRLNGLEHSPYYRTLPGVKITIDENDCLIIDAPAIAKKPVHTTDIVRITNDGEFELRGRHDHVINSGGIKFSPEIIERKLAPLIGERFIISSIADRVLGEKLILIVESKRWDPLIIRQLESAIRERLTPYERPKMFFFLEAFPIAGNEKISRKAITETAMRSLQNESENAG